MQQPRHPEEGAALARGRAGEQGVLPRLGHAALLLEPGGEDVVVVDDADAVLQALPERGSARVVAAQGVLDLGRVAQPAHAPAQRVKLRGQEALADVAEFPHQLCALLFAQRPHASEHTRRVGGPAVQQPSQVAAQPVDVEVQHVLGDLCPAARARGAQPAEERPLLGGGGLERRQPVHVKAQGYVHVPACADGAGQPAQDLDGLAHRPASAPCGRAAGARRAGGGRPPGPGGWAPPGRRAPRASSRKTRLTRSSRRRSARSSGLWGVSRRHHREPVSYHGDSRATVTVSGLEWWTLSETPL